MKPHEKECKTYKRFNLFSIRSCIKYEGRSLLSDNTILNRVWIFKQPHAPSPVFRAPFLFILRKRKLELSIYKDSNRWWNPRPDVTRYLLRDIFTLKIRVSRNKWVYMKCSLLPKFYWSYRIVLFGKHDTPVSVCNHQCCATIYLFTFSLDTR